MIAKDLPQYSIVDKVPDSLRLSPAEWCTTTRPETVGVSLPE